MLQEHGVLESKMKNILYLMFEIPSWIIFGFLAGEGLIRYFNAPDWILAVTIIFGVIAGFIRMILILKPKA